jgi:hypothetical protein
MRMRRMMDRRRCTSNRRIWEKWEEKLMARRKRIRNMCKYINDYNSFIDCHS